MKNLLPAVVALIALAVAFPAGAVEVFRNGIAYNIDLRAKFTKQGVDRKFNIAGSIPGHSISGNFRLIQDSYSECETLVAERRTGQAKNGFTRQMRNHVTRRQCVISLANPSTGMEMSSYYIWLDVCKCFSALHFVHRETDSLFSEAVIRGMVTQLRNLSRSPGGTSGQPVASSDQSEWGNLDDDWKEGVRILHKRGFTPEMVVAIQGNFFGDAMAQGILDPRLREEGIYDYIASIYGVRQKDGDSYRFVHNSKQRVPVPDLAFDLETGRSFWKKGVTPQQMAKSISACYKRMDYRAKCKLNYHSQMGCRMTSTWKRFCRKTATDKAFSEYGDLCFWTPRGDLPMMAASESMEKTVMLPSAGGKKKSPKNKSIKTNVPLCDDKMLSSYQGRF